MNYQLMPDLSLEEYQSLKDDIQERGILVPIEMDEQGNVLDGHHRLKAWQELREAGIKVSDYQTLIRVGMTEEQKEEYVLSLNLNRRHLTTEQRKEMARTLILRDWSKERIINHLHIDFDTIKGEISASGIPEPARVTGLDGKSYPAHKTKTVDVKNSKESKAVFEALSSLPADKLPDHMIDAKRASRLSREYQAERRSTDMQDTTLGNAHLVFGDFRERGSVIPDTFVDLIFTDPPYAEEYLPLWKDLSSLAARILKPEGMLIAYTGAMYLPTILASLGGCLRFWWAGSVILDGPHSRIFARNISQGSKPLLFYVRQDYQPREWFEDTYRGEGEQKDFHDWQQSIGPAKYYITKLTKPGDLVLDPFMGSGTTGLAAIGAGRNFLGIDNDPTAYLSAAERIKTWINQSKT